MKLEKVSKERFPVIDLDHFDRRHDVKRVYVNENGSCELRDRVWTMDWSLEKKRQVAADLLSEDCVSYVATDDENVVGFVSVYKKLNGQRMVLNIIQVDRALRGKGLGRKLFHLAVEEARLRGAKELYISACCSEETVGFYKAMGATVTDDPIASIVEEEPWDIQMIYSIEAEKKDRMTGSICGLDCSGCSMRGSCGGCAATGGKPFGGECMVAKCCAANKAAGCGDFSKNVCLLKQRLIAQFNALGIADMPPVTDLYALVGSFVNLEYTLPGGQTVKFWDDKRIYLGNQLPKTGTDRCYGLTADENYLLVCEYGENGVEPEIVVYQKRREV